mgnify:CR=1 FL=1
MAGLKAATVAPTWPTINGQWAPDNLMVDKPAALNFINNKVLIHFIHRGLAYVLLVLIIIWSVKLFRANGPVLFTKTRGWPLVIMMMQLVLGIVTVLSSTGIVPGHWGVFEWMAQLHQLTGMFLLLSLVWMLFILRGGAARG